MKTNLIIVIIITLIFLQSGVYADRDILNTFNSDNVTVEAYDCLDSNCTTVDPFSGSFPNGNTTTTGSVLIRYPTTLSTYGYAIYYYSSEYIPKAYKTTYYGVYNSSGYKRVITNVPITFNKKTDCYSTINGLSIINKDYPANPIQTSQVTQSDGTMYSVYQEADNGIDYIPTPYKNEFYSSDIQITFSIIKGSVLQYEVIRNYTNTVGDYSTALYMDTSRSLQYMWTPTTTGAYSMNMTTHVLDKQCLNVTDLYSASIFSVI